MISLVGKIIPLSEELRRGQFYAFHNFNPNHYRAWHGIPDDIQVVWADTIDNMARLHPNCFIEVTHYAD